ncbi:hypothetical protein DEO72_LG7g476 [Vigna unguiculata]|uniref:Uncharacterized protein n=1 Tax=Vigna unguiculata TaxID=3917 RepID=A0A4D6MCV6_VIGUN|nr:hypothetical protein DEO72_LG7g476 [Vigna unguiculata]
MLQLGLNVDGRTGSFVSVMKLCDMTNGDDDNECGGAEQRGAYVASTVVVDIRWNRWILATVMEFLLFHDERSR